METILVFETGDYIPQGENVLFTSIEKSANYHYFRGTKDLSAGYIKQLSCHGKLFIERMDYQFYQPVSKKYHTTVPFIEILCLDSINLQISDGFLGEFSINKGVYVYHNTGNEGTLVFQPKNPVRGIRIIIFEEFYNHDFIQKFHDDNLNLDHLSNVNNYEYSNPPLQLVCSQIKQSMDAGITSEPYYESKAAEILFLIAWENKHIISSGIKKNTIRQNDLCSVNEVKNIINTHISNTPKIAEIASSVKVSAAKLQIDFQTAFGCTIHEYVQKARMKEALCRIEHTDDPLYRISKEVGCKNPGRFAELFKITFGMSPSEYRKSHRS
ncbi:AraC family transcriptional regulator [Treponema primitia]|uniref:helix-turn-helix domain-containing protein n=1 Tax=Treponema primitia TaxID=88058 RepID=UPI00397FC1C1